MAPLGVAVIGCGTISDEYLRNLTAFPDLRVLCCADLTWNGPRTRPRSTACPPRAPCPRRSGTTAWNWS